MSIANEIQNEVLIDRARMGDKASLERLLILCRPDLERYARRNCQSDDVEEAVQDALWILYRRAGSLRTIAALSGWLYQVVRRACLSYVRRRKPTNLSIEQLPLGADYDATAVDSELRVIVTNVLSTLPHSYREIVILKDIQGHSADEIAMILGITLEATKSRLHRARAQIRAAMTDPPISSMNLPVK